MSGLANTSINNWVGCLISKFDFYRPMQPAPLLSDQAVRNPKSLSFFALQAVLKGLFKNRELAQLPRILRVQVINAKVHSANDWIKEMRAIEPSDIDREFLLSSSAYDLTAKLNIQRDHAMSSVEQLWNQIFLDAFTRADLDGKREIIAFAAKVDGPAMEQTAFRATAYRVTSCAISFFSSTIVRWTVAIVAFFVIQSVTKAAMRVFQNRCLPFLAHKVMVHIPHSNIKVMHKAYGFGAEMVTTYKRNWITLWIGTGLISYLFGSSFPAAKVPYQIFTMSWKIVYTYPRNIAYWAYWLPCEIGWRAGSFSFTAHTQISRAASQEISLVEGGNLALGGQLAHGVWMRLMNQALTGGITLPVNIPA